MANLKDKDGVTVYPNTKTDYVTDDNGNTVEERLTNLESATSADDSWTAATLTTAASGYALYRFTADARINPFASTDADCNIYVADVVEYESIKISASRKTGAYGAYVFVDKRGFTVEAAVTTNLTSVVDFEVTVPVGATRVYINENATLNGSGSSKLYRKALSGQAMAAYNEKVTDNEKITDAELLKYYNLGAQAMDTYNLVEEKVGIIVLGQSNADGRIAAADFPASATINESTLSLSSSVPTCYYMKGGSGTTYDESESTFAAWNNSGVWAFDQVLYNAVANALGDTSFYVCKQTIGATSLQYRYNTSFWADIDDFKSNSGYYSQLYHLKCLVQSALAQQPDLKFKAIVMHQGEADQTVSYTEGAYYVALCKMIQWVRGLVGSPNLPFIFGTVPSNSAEYSEIIYNDMVRVAADMDNVYMVDMGEATGWVADGMDVHFCADDAVTFADEMYQIMVNNKMLAPYV